VHAIQFDILRRHHDGSLLWLEAAADLKVAKSRLQQLCAALQAIILCSTREASKLSLDPRN
jgi:hypothetical protein